MNQPKLNELERRLADLFGRINYERRLPLTPRSFKLVGIRKLIAELGNPHLSYPVIHVAGTKGKGSVATMIGSIMTKAGLKTGVYTSPHMETIHQRLRIDGQMIGDDQLLDLLDELQPTLNQFDAEADSRGRRGLTFFEVTTAAMFYHFAKQKVDAAVVEVGLGGRLDTTNVCQPTVCVITNISYDHTRILGETLPEIAAEKAGIIKTGVPVVSGSTDTAANAVIRQIADKKGSDLYVLDRDFDCRHDSTRGTFSTRGRVEGSSYEMQNIRPGMIGNHQSINASLAIAVTQILNTKGFAIGEEAIAVGLADAHLVGRTEIISKNPLVVVDMAHNVASVAALIETLQNEVAEWKSAGTEVVNGLQSG